MMGENPLSIILGTLRKLLLLVCECACDFLIFFFILNLRKATQCSPFLIPTVCQFMVTGKLLFE